MFEESLVESTPLLQNRNRWPALLSFTAQAIVAAILIAVPMLHPELLPMHAPALTLAPPPVPHIPPTPPPPQPVHAELASSTAPTAPSAPPAQPSLIHTLVPIAISTVDTPISGFVGTMTSPAGTSLSAIASTGRSPRVTVASAAPPATHTSLVKLSSGITAGMLISPIRPDYPAIARAAGVQGSVVVRAIISRTGQIESAQVVSGSPMLSTAALEAVQHARYKPYLLNGEPTEVDTTITINFHLGG